MITQRRGDILTMIEQLRRTDLVIPIEGVPIPWTVPAYVNTWAQYTDPEFGTGAYRVEASGKVSLKGLVMHTAAGAAGTTIFTLPVGMRPGKHKIWPVMTGNGIERVEVRSTGAVNYGGSIATVAWAALDPISFWPGG